MLTALGPEHGGMHQDLSQNHSDVFSVLNENQALSVGPIEHFVKLHSQIYSLLNLRETYNVAKSL